MNVSLWEQFLHVIHSYRLINPGDTVVAAVSGGPDSLALLHLLWRLPREAECPLQLVVAHLNHGIRPEAGAEAAFVARTAQEWGLPYVEKTVDVPAMAREPGLSLEEAARLARYGFLLAAAREHGASAVAVGHNADDQVESIVMHWLRGAGLAGLRGMSANSRLSELRLGPALLPPADSVRLIRPLIESPRFAIEAYCRQQGLHPCRDRSNLDTALFRNRLRRRLIPYLERYNPNVRSVLRRSARVIANDYDYLHQQVLRAWSEVAREVDAGALAFDRAAWASLHPSLQAGLLREAIHRLRWTLRNINYVHIEGALSVLERGRVGSKATLPQGLLLTIGYGSFWIAEHTWQPAESTYPTIGPEGMPLPVPGRLFLADGAWVLTAECAAAASLGEVWQTNSDHGRAYVDAGRVDLEALALRIRRPGDRFQPLGLGGRSSDVREFLINAKVPQAVRPAFPLLVAGDDIVWLPGLRLDERCKIGPGTERILILSLTRGAGRCEENRP